MLWEYLFRERNWGADRRNAYEPETGGDVMRNSRDPLRLLAYFIVGLLALIVAVNVIAFVLRLALTLVQVVVTIALVVLVGYLVYHLVKAAARNLDG